MLVNESMQPRTYEVSFDGSKLTSGVYFYKISVFTLLPELLECNNFVNADNIAYGLSPFNPKAADF